MLPYRVHVHLLEVKSVTRNFPESGQRAMHWVAVEQAIEAVWNPELKQGLQALTAAR